MSEFKGTPGPWGASGKLYIEELEEEVLPVDAQGKEVAYVPFRRGEYKVTGEANARLIAAAPELLEALLKLDSYLDFHMPIADGVPLFDDTSGINIAMEEARTAIAKALGNE